MIKKLGLADGMFRKRLEDLKSKKVFDISVVQRVRKKIEDL